MNGQNDLDSHTSIYFTDFVSKSGHDPKKFPGTSVKDLPVVGGNFAKKHLYIRFRYPRR